MLTQPKDRPRAPETGIFADEQTKNAAEEERRGEQQADDRIDQKRHQQADQCAEAEQDDADDLPCAVGLRRRRGSGVCLRRFGCGALPGLAAADKRIECDAKELAQAEQLFKLQYGAVGLPLRDGLPRDVECVRDVALRQAARGAQLVDLFSKSHVGYLPFHRDVRQV